MNHNITISHEPIAEYGKTLMLRGFAEFISWKHIKNSSEFHHICIVKDIIKIIKSNNYQSIVWDGDLYRSDSFTHLIYEMMDVLSEQINFIAYKPDETYAKFLNGDKKNCEVGWCDMKTKIKRNIILNKVELLDGLKWYEKYTQLTKHIFSDVLKKASKISLMYIGGGNIIKSEMQNLCNYVPQSNQHKLKLWFVDIPRAVFAVDEAGHPCAKIQYLGNSSESINPIDILPSGYILTRENKNIELSFSKVKYLVEYMLKN